MGRNTARLLEAGRATTVIVALTAAGLSPVARAQATPVAHASAARQVRSTTDLATGWRFDRADPVGAQGTAFDDRKWQRVSLPHTWNAFDGEDGSAAGQNSSYYGGPGWYRLHLAIPATVGADGSPMRWYLQFDAASLAADVYVNGVLAGHHDGGFTAFRFDITGYVTPGTTALVAVRVDNSGRLPIIPLAGDFTVFGGLYRMAHLVGVDGVHVTMADHGGPGVVLQPTVNSDGTGTLRVATDVVNDNSSDAAVDVTTTIVDGSGATVGSATSPQVVAAGSSVQVTESVGLASVHRWDGVNDPYLYRAEVTVSGSAGLVDEVDQNIGFRTFTVDASTGAWLNGHPYQLRGVSVHQDWQDEGWAISDAQTDADVSSVLQLGANAIRLSHYPHSARLSDDADAAGLALWTELPLVDSAASSDPNFTSITEQQLVEMIRQNQNHPSVLVWGLSNELKVINHVDPAPLVADLNTLAHQTDPTRMTTLAACQSSKCPSLTSTQNKTTDLLGLNDYTGWYQGTTSEVAGQLDSYHAAQPGRAIGLSEFGAGASPDFHTDQPVPLQRTEEYAVIFHEAYLKAVAARPWLWCVFMWNLADHASDSKNIGDAAGRGDAGLLSYDRSIKKDDWYLYQAWWSPAPVIRLGSARWTQRNNRSTTITAISNAVKVEAFLNGTSLGVIAADGSHLFGWPATLTPGDNTISLTATMADNTTHTDAATWNLHTTAVNSALIDVGSATPTVDSQGRTWHADTGYTGTNTTADYPGTVHGTADPAIAASYRIGQSYYDIPLDNGTYTVTLRLLEPTWTKKGKRLFNISAQGQNQVVLLDLAKLVGQGTEHDVTFTTTVANHALALAFQASVDQAVISAIEVEPG